MSYWRSQGWFNSSPINKLLENETITLTEIFEQDDILTELKTNNKKLIDFLKQKQNLEKMIEYLLLESDSTDENKKYKYPWICAEILSHDSSVVDLFFDSVEYYGKLLDYLFSPSVKKNSTFLTTYVCKIFCFYLLKNSTKVIEIFKSKENEILNYLENIDNSSVLELLLKIFVADLSEHQNGVSDWLLKLNLNEILIEKLTPQHNYNTHENIAQLFNSIITLSLQVTYSPLLDHLRSEKTITRIFEILRSNNCTKENLEDFMSSTKFGFAILNDIVRLHFSNMGYDNATPFDRLPGPIQICLNNVDLCVSLLKTSSQLSNEIETTFGKIVPLGSHRLQIVEYLQTLCSTRFTCIYSHLLSNDVIATLYDLFFEYPWNNLLHIMVSQITHNMFECDNEQIVHQLFTTTQFHVRLANAGISSVDKESKRLGLMGVVYKLALSIQNLNHASILQILGESEEWENYINSDFLENKKKEAASIGKASSPADDDHAEEQNNEEMNIFQARTKRNFEIIFPEDFAERDFDDKELEPYFLANDANQMPPICPEEDGLDVFAQFVEAN